jgi:hypothetical protein
MSALTQTTLLGAKVVVSKASVAKRTNVVTRAGQYDDELLQTAVWISSSFLRLNFSSLFATWVKFFFTFYARVDSTRGERRREAFGSVCVAVKLNALDFVRFERGRFLRRICSRCCCCCVCSSARFSMMMMMMIISDCVWTTEKLSPLFSSAR